MSVHNKYCYICYLLFNLKYEIFFNRASDLDEWEPEFSFLYELDLEKFTSNASHDQPKFTYDFCY
jgi:hypothetical protein